MIDINLNALYYLSHEVAKVMIKQNRERSLILLQCNPFGPVNLFFHTLPATRCGRFDQAYADALAADNIQVMRSHPVT
ncbi:hypothetical protein Q757_03670, partial [Oenococcus alcoholitolerans]